MDHDTTLKAPAAALLGGLTALFGWFGWLVILFILCMGIDYTTGSIAAMRTGEWTSKAARTGLWHKAGSLIAVSVAGLTDMVVGLIVNNISAIALPFDYSVLICPLVLTWYIITELGSIMENAGALGAPIPAFLRKIIKALGDSVDTAANGLVSTDSKRSTDNEDD